jgi:type IX secretion system PorP/SprF family membrane protein
LAQLRAWGQEPQFSQLYANPILLNPARTGYEQSLGSEGVIARFQHRIQWPQLNSSFVTSMASVDGFEENINLGVGLSFMKDQQGDFFQTNRMGLNTAYHAQLSDNGNFIHVGFEASHTSLSYGASGLIFMDQLTGGGISSSSVDPLSAVQFQRNYWNISTGGLFEIRTENDQRLALGISARNLLAQNLSAFTSTNPIFTSPLYALELGFQKWYGLASKNGLGGAESRWVAFEANAYLKSQGANLQLDLGVSYSFDYPLRLGLAYRGIPLRRYNDIIQQDALVALIGADVGDLSFRYSYDIGISSLSRAGGSHEFSLKIRFGTNFNILTGKERRERLQHKCPTSQN